MSVGSLDAAKRICELGSWRVTNLALQKILYMAHMVHMGRYDGAHLIDGEFEAWDYGPVEPNVYQKVKAFGSKAIPNFFFSSRPIPDGIEDATIKEACEHLLRKSPGELVAMTHWQGGAWAKNYVPGVRGITISDADIICEYKARIAPK